MSPPAPGMQPKRSDVKLAMGAASGTLNKGRGAG